MIPRVRLWLSVLLVTAFLTGCGGPTMSDSDPATAVPPTPTSTPEPPTAAVGRTIGAPCESGRLRFSDLPLMTEQWEAGLAVARGRALDWQADAFLVELRVACGLFEPGFRWQATYYSTDAQSYYATDTAEVVPIDLDPSAVEALREQEIDFLAIQESLSEAGYTDETAALESITLQVSTRKRPVGPPGVPEGTAIAHVKVTDAGRTDELYVDVSDGRIYRY